MAILANDIKLLASRVMDDVPEGGGAPTATVIVDGASNAIFPDISELDRAGGDVSFRKLFIHVQTDDRDTYLGSNVIVAQPPSDPNVSVTLFSTNEVFDERTDASGRVESYLIAGPASQAFLLENHIAGQRVIQMFQRPEAVLPSIGDTLILIYHEGLSDEVLQYVRVVDIESEIRSYTGESTNKPYTAAVVSCGLSDPLREDFPGSPPSEFFRAATTGTKLRETTVGDAAVYAGVAETTVAIEIGDVAATVESVFTQLVPSAQTEIPLVDQDAAGQSAAITASGDGTVSYTTSQPFNSETSLSLGNSVVPGTLSITTTGGTITDTGGQVFDGATAIGTVDYARGTVSFAALNTTYSGSKTVTFEPAAAPSRVSDTAQIEITEASRSYNYIMTILPTPAAGTVTVSYRAQGRWYDLYDNGGGVLRGTDSSYGVGTVNYGTGTVSVTLGALPDDGSSVMIFWGSKVNYINRAGMSVLNPSVRFTLAEGNIQPDSVVITWNDGTARTASDNGLGVLSGDATGTVDYETGAVHLIPTLLPAGGQEYTAGYEVGMTGGLDDQFVAPERNLDGSIDIETGLTDVVPGTLRLQWMVRLTDPVTVNSAGSQYTEWTNTPYRTAKDNGVGGIVDVLGATIGTFNYTTGALHLAPDGNVTARGVTFQRLSGPSYPLLAGPA